MPELPEVETVRRALEMGVVGLQVTDVSGVSVMMRRPLEIPHLTSRMRGRWFSGVRRRGKFLLLDLDDGSSLLVHLGMSGKLLLDAGDGPKLPHTHLTIALADDSRLRFVDPRRFGFATLLESGDEHSDPSLVALGLDPLARETEAVLPVVFRNRRSPVKVLMLDQRIIAGIGNIYAAEALWRAGIRPTRQGCHTSTRRLRSLAVATRRVLQEAVDQGGTTLRDYATPDGTAGYFAINLNVYGRKGKPCPACGATLRNTRIAGRATVWCPSCQR